MQLYDGFTNLQTISKTLRFELQPIGDTQRIIDEQEMLKEDFERSECYPLVKEMIDEEHKRFIDIALSGFLFSDKLKEYAAVYESKDTDGTRSKKLDDISAVLRKETLTALKKHDDYGVVSKPAELIKKKLAVEKQGAEKEAIDKFIGFPMYFTGLQEARNNMYTDEEKSTAIPYRAVNDNLPKFIDNIKSFREIVKHSEITDTFGIIKEGLDLATFSVDDFFTVDFYSFAVTQKDIERYNMLIGGKKTKDEKQIIKGLNQYINEYNQTHPKERLPLLKPLYKQILSDRESLSFMPEKFSDDNALLQSVRIFYDDRFKAGDFSALFDAFDGFDMSGIFIRNNLDITDISQKVYGDWSIVNRYFSEKFDKENTKKFKTDEERDKARNTYCKSFESISVAKLEEIADQSGKVSEYIKQAVSAQIITIAENYSVAKTLLNNNYPADKKLISDQESIALIKELLDSIKELHRIILTFRGSGKETDKDEVFYGKYDKLIMLMDEFTPLYDKVRNHLTQKPYSEKKIKVNFSSKNLGGWVESVTDKSDNATQYGGYLFRKKNSIGEYDYYLGLSKNTKLFRILKKADISDSNEYERLEYYQPKSQTIYGKAYKGKNSYEADKKTLKDFIIHYLITTNETDLIEKVRQYFNSDKSTPTGAMKRIASEYPDIYNKLLQSEEFKAINKEIIINIKNTLRAMNRIPDTDKITDKEYSLFTEIMADVDKLMSYRVFSYFHVSTKEWNDTVKDKKKPLLVFKITNKDLSFAETYSSGLRKKRGKENLHTMYFKTMMNGNQNVFDIGSAVVFFRQKSLNYSDEILINGHHAKDLKGKFSYPIIKDYRYARDQFSLHLSIQINYNCEKPNTKTFNSKVQDAIRREENINVIGIDRGERNLLYISVIDSQGHILEQKSLNVIGDKETDYQKKLSDREKQRQENRQSWSPVEGIKNLKEGYLSQVVHIIAKLMVKYNAVLFMEDLNAGMKHSRVKFEKQVYDKFENALVSKLCFYVDKEINKEQGENAPGGLLKAYQLANVPSGKKDRSKQNGFIFYIPAWNTSKIDPVTGFVNLFNLNLTSKQSIVDFFGKFKNIRYNSEKNYFEFSFNYHDFGGRANNDYRNSWTVCTFGKRIREFRDPKSNNQWNCENYYPTTEMKALLERYGIDFNSGTLMEDILSAEESKFFKDLLCIFKLTLQMRNSLSGSTKPEDDYIISPVADKNGVFYDSRKHNNSSSLPCDADANGAYNIARKGLWVVKNIKAAGQGEKTNMYISNKEWLELAQRGDMDNGGSDSDY